MHRMSDLDLRFPIGKFHSPTLPLTAAARQALIDDIERLPGEFRSAAAGLDERRLETPYRPGGWTGRQVIHHVPDSHMNAYIRFKLALTEASPTIKPYQEAEWAKLADSRGPAAPSLDLLELLHERWIVVLRHMGESDFARTYLHPAMGAVTLDTAIALYSWHGKHHTGHLKSLQA